MFHLDMVLQFLEQWAMIETIVLRCHKIKGLLRVIAHFFSSRPMRIQGMRDPSGSIGINIACYKYRKLQTYFYNRQALTVQFPNILSDLFTEYRSSDVIAKLGGDLRADRQSMFL